MTVHSNEASETFMYKAYKLVFSTPTQLVIQRDKKKEDNCPSDLNCMKTCN